MTCRHVYPSPAALTLAGDPTMDTTLPRCPPPLPAKRRLMGAPHDARLKCETFRTGMCNAAGRGRARSVQRGDRVRLGFPCVRSLLWSAEATSCGIWR